MPTNRFVEPNPPDDQQLPAPSAFLVLPGAPGGQPSSIEWLYQQLYQQAQQANQPRPTRELFVIMN